jgi:GNAT superfamily N-acetyltransferase
MARMHIRQARSPDAPAVAAILHEAATWLADRGTPMWRANELEVTRIAGDVGAGLYWLAEAGEPAGTMRLQLSDPEFWPDVPEGSSVFLHRLAVRRQFAGGQVSSALLSFAAAWTRERGRRFLRLDCEARRPRLRAIYERAGFTHHSDRQCGPYFVSRYELAVEAGDARGPGHDPRDV